MNQQLQLLDIPQSRKGKYAVFVALFPKKETIASILGQQKMVHREFGIVGSDRPPHHFHVTVFGLGKYHSVSDFFVKTVSNACAEAAKLTAPFEIEFE
jgi:hypothetical protein